MSERVLYDLVASATKDRFSPFCFRVKLALAHKDLSFRCELVSFTDKDKIAFSGQKLVPVLVEPDATVVCDSFKILQHLEQHYPQAPLLTPGDASLGFLRAWVDRSLLAATFKLLAPKIHGLLQGEDQAYFQSTREQRMGITLDALARDEGKYRSILNTTLEPLRALLSTQPCVAGASVGAGDVLILGNFLWAEGVLGEPLLPPDDPISAWRQRMNPWVEKALAMAAIG
jgi:glutathione S-transferase